MNSAVIDASILTDHMMLEAASLGPGSVWLCRFKADVLKKEFCLSDELDPVNILAFGWSAHPPADVNRHERLRIPMKELLDCGQPDNACSAGRGLRTLSP